MRLFSALNFLKIVLGLIVFLGLISKAFADYTWENVPAGYGLAWSDEFNGAVGSAPNSTYWSYDTGTGQPNDELENYTNSTNNCKVIADPNAVDGKSLAIISLDPGGNNDVMGDYTSARIDTEDKKTFTYGYMEARVRMPYGQGIWPAFWMLGNDIDTVSWPACGEIDIMENIGNAGDQGTNHMSLHDGNDVTTYLPLPGGQLYHNAYHTFAALWQSNQIQFFVDGNLMATDTPASLSNNWAFNNNPSFFLLNVAVGGDWPGNPDGTTSFPQTMLVDYVRAYQTGFATPTPVVQSTWRVRCGGDAYTDSNNNLWSADTNFTGGWPANPTTNTIAGALPAAADQTLYQWERYGNATGGQTLTYTFNVPTGSNYQVTLKFSEDYWTAAGQREFNYSINGATEATNFDIYATAGTNFKAVDKVYTITPNASGQIVIQLSPGAADSPKIDAIQIIPVAGSPTATPTFTPTATRTPTATFTPTPVIASTWRVNAGGPSYTDSKGNVWSADENYSGGTEAVTTSTMTNTSDSTLYQSQRYASSFSYTFNVPAGSYQVSLLFAETYWTAAGDRIFNVSIDGSTVLTNFDIFATAGAQNKAVTEIFNNIPPSGGTITIQLGPASADNAEIQAIQIIPQPATPTFSPTATRTFTATSTGTSTATLTSTLTNTPIPPTATFTPTATTTFTRSATSTLTPVPPTATFTNTAIPATSTLTSTPTSTASFTITSTNTPVALTATPTSTSVPPTFTFTSTLTSVPVNTNTPTITFTGTVPPTLTSTNTVVPPTLTFTLTSTPVPPTLTPTLSPTAVFTNTFTRTPTTTSTLTDTPVPPTFTWTPTKTWTPVFTNTFTFTKTNTPVPTNTWTFTRTYTPVPTNTFTITPTWTPTISSACAGVAAWSGNFVYYAIGARVTYNAELYQCIQAHTSESTWEPPVVPALWKDLGPCTGAAGKISLVSAVSYPNPSTTGNTTLYYQIQGNGTTGSVVSSEGVVSEPGSVVYLKIYSTAGRLIWSKTMTGQDTVSGDHNVAWNCKDASGVNLANGVYYYTVTLKTPENQDTKKVPLLILR